MEKTVKQKKSGGLFSASLFKQSFKSNWSLWLIMSLGCAAIFVIINVVLGSKSVFTKIDMGQASTYVQDEGLSWLQVLGLLENMGFSLTRIQTMSRMDLNAVMNDLVYKIAGVLLPMIYVMITSNKLIASQVSDGSMAYVLSTPTNRKKVVFTQLVFLLGSVFAMYIIITVFAISSQAVSAWIIKMNTGNTVDKMYFRTFLYCLASLCAMFGLSGLCFGASAFFNKSAQSVAVGGGICVISFLCCILGLFGTEAFVSTGIGVQAMSIFNYASIFTLIDTTSINNFAKAIAGMDATISFNWIWENAILIAIGVVGIIIGAIKFEHKDLPL